MQKAEGWAAPSGVCVCAFHKPGATQEASRAQWPEHCQPPPTPCLAFRAVKRAALAFSFSLHSAPGVASCRASEASIQEAEKRVYVPSRFLGLNAGSSRSLSFSCELCQAAGERPCQAKGGNHSKLDPCFLSWQP